MKALQISCYRNASRYSHVNTSPTTFAQKNPQEIIFKSFQINKQKLV